MADENKVSRADLIAEKEALELEQLRASVETTRNAKRMRKEAREDNERSFREKALKDAATQASCNHKKGGRDYAATQKRGDGDNHCIAIHTYPMGNTNIHCTRCLFMWQPGDGKQFLKDGVTKNPTGLSWAEAVKLPTDNSPSGSVLFGPRPTYVIA